MINKHIAFVFLSGLGWLFDLLLYGFLLIIIGLPLAFANFASATIAAIVVFNYARVKIFRATNDREKSLLIYFFYTELNIVLWSLIIDFITRFVSSSYGISFSTTAIYAKILVTPFSLVCNFIFAQFLTVNKNRE
jgi:putative flippase GtrA